MSKHHRRSRGRIPSSASAKAPSPRVPSSFSDPSARAEIMQKISATIISLYQSGLISASAALEELRSQGRELGVFSNLTLPGPAAASSVSEESPSPGDVACQAIAHNS